MNSYPYASPSPRPYGNENPESAKVKLPLSRGSIAALIFSCLGTVLFVVGFVLMGFEGTPFFSAGLLSMIAGFITGLCTLRHKTKNTVFSKLAIAVPFISFVVFGILLAALLVLQLAYATNHAGTTTGI